MNAYETITARIITQLEGGVIPWRKPWNASAIGSAFPHNFTTGKSYRGANILSLMCSPFTSSAWMTYKQAQAMGGQVRKGEKASPVMFWQFPARKGSKPAEPVADGASDDKRAPWSKLYWVFNLEQIDGIQPKIPFDAPAFNPIESADRIVSAYLGCGNAPSLAHGGDRAFYRPSADAVQMPHPGTFDKPENYYCTLFHEFGHSTGHTSRLDRKLSGGFGSRDYSDEELCAEFTAAFVSAEAGISNDGLLDNSAAYISNWLEKLRNDSKMAVYAAQRAQKAADLILGRSATSEVSEVAE